jgi:hypothetical protein
MSAPIKFGEGENLPAPDQFSSRHNQSFNGQARNEKASNEKDCSSNPEITLFTEDHALALLQQPDLDPSVIEQLAGDRSLRTSRKIRCSLVAHVRTPRHISLPLLRQLYTFDLMQVALTPAVAGDLKRAADEILCNRLSTIASGERLSLARRGSGRVAAALLEDKEARVMRAALENPRLTEAYIVRAIAHGSNASFVETVCHHPQWSLRREVRIALLRHEKTPMARAVEFARGLPPAQLREILQNSRLPENIKAYLLRDMSHRRRGAGAG